MYGFGLGIRLQSYDFTKREVGEKSRKVPSEGNMERDVQRSQQPVGY